MSKQASKLATFPPPRHPVPESSPVDLSLPLPSSEEIEGDFSDAEFFEDVSMEEPQISRPVEGVPSRIEYRRNLRQRERFLIDPLLPQGTMNLLGGPSGIGKTTWLFQQLYDWSVGRPILGKYKATPTSFVYVSFDRGVLETDRTLRRLGYANWDIPIYSIEDLGNEPDIQIVFDRFPKVDLYVIEGLQAALPDGKGNQNRIEMRWAIDVRKRMLAKGKTILATTHSPKSQVDSAHSRSNFLGSVSLHACFSTMISFDIPQAAREAAKGKVVHTDNREVLIQGRDFADIKLSYSRDDNGRFRLLDSQMDNEIKLDSWFADLPNSTTIKSSMLEAKARSCQLSRAGLFRWITQMLKDGRLTRPVRGQYFKVN
jgi:hypothetical protein